MSQPAGIPAPPPGERRASGWPTANQVTGLRLVLLPVFVAAAVAAQQQAAWGWIAGGVFSVAAASDVADGRIARATGQASNAGRFFDHFADIGFILGSLSTYVALGLLPWWVPVSIGLSFATYVIDSLRRSPRAPSLIASRLGHAGGVANYVLIGVLVFNESAHLQLLPQGFLFALYVLVPIYSAGAVMGRFVGRRAAT